MAEEMDDQKSEGIKDGEEERRRKLLEKGKGAAG